jgi:exodeoxyribonuclease VIII
MPGREYHALEATSKTRLWDFGKSERAVRDGIGFTGSPAAAFGSLVHGLLLEPQHFDRDFSVAPECDRRTKEGKAAWADYLIASAGKEVVTQEQVDAAKACVSAIYEQHGELVRPLLAGAMRECSIVWTDEATGMQCKARPDAVAGSVLVDLKTTVDVSPHTIRRIAAQRGWHAQLGWYAHALGLTGHSIEYAIVVAVESSAPYECAVYEVAQESLRAGLDECRELLARYAAAKASGQYRPRYQDVMPLALPSWYKKGLDAEDDLG